MNQSFIALDFETANYKRDSACSIGLVRVENSEIVAKECKLINPQTNFIEEFIGIHGIMPEDVEDAPLFDEAWNELIPLLKGAEFIAAHNAPFDRSVLYECCESYRLKVPKQRFVCTVKLSRELWGIHPTKLNDVCNHLGIELNHHEALSDALACAQIVISALTEGHEI